MTDDTKATWTWHLRKLSNPVDRGTWSASARSFHWRCRLSLTEKSKNQILFHLCWRLIRTLLALLRIWIGPFGIGCYPTSENEFLTVLIEVHNSWSDSFKCMSKEELTFFFGWFLPFIAGVVSVAESGKILPFRHWMQILRSRAERDKTEWFQKNRGTEQSSSIFRLSRSEK